MNNQTIVELILAVALSTGPMAAQAVTLQINGSGILTGALDVDVGGTLYDVQLLDGSCTSLFTGCDNAADDFAFTTSADAVIAAQALLDQVFTDTPSGQFGTHPELTNGCNQPGFCGVFIPYAVGNGFVDMVDAENFFLDEFDTIILSPGDAITDTTQNGAFTFAVWSVASVPTPGTLALLGLGLLGLGIVRRMNVRSTVPLSLCVILGACTTIKINEDETSTIEYEGGVEVAKGLTTRACLRAGQQSAEIISTVNKDPALPAGTGKQVTTFRCVAAAKQQ